MASRGDGSPARIRLIEASVRSRCSRHSACAIGSWDASVSVNAVAGPVANAGTAVEPAQSLFAGRPAETCERIQRPQCQQNEQHDACGACNERQHQPEAGPGHHEKQSDDAQEPGQRPARRAPTRSHI